MTLVETRTTPRQSGKHSSVFRLVTVHAPEPSSLGQAFLLSDERVSLGRSRQTVDLALDDGEVSRVHAELTLDEAGSWALADLGSRNGTYVNAERIERRVMQDQDVVRIGGHLLLFEVLDDGAQARLIESLPGDGRLIGESHRMLGLRGRLAEVARAAGPVLVLGETGTGKERVAEAIHQRSGRSGAFVPVNCGALPENLVESELFGHVGGAFTGAAARAGLFSRAQGGTLFLDEIGDMELGLQKRLLRVLATGEVRAVGSDTTGHIDVRIVAATHVDLPRAIEGGRFRADLHARLLAHMLHVPPLRMRRDDIMPLLHHFIERAGRLAAIGPDVAEALLVHDWPYNVRELEQMVGSLEPVLGRRRALELTDLPGPLQQRLEGRRGSAVAAEHAAPAAVLGISRKTPPSKADLMQLLELYQGNVAHVALFFRKGRRQVYRWVKQHGIEPAVFRDGERGDAALDPDDAIEPDTEAASFDAAAPARPGHDRDADT